MKDFDNPPSESIDESEWTKGYKYKSGGRIWIIKRKKQVKKIKEDLGL